MDPRVSIVTLGVADLARSRAFYRDGLGLPERPGEADAGITFFALGALLLALYPWQALAEDVGCPPAGSGFRGITLAHNVASTAAVDALLLQAVAAGGTLVKAAGKVFWGGYSGYFADPDGHLWEVAWNPWYEIPA